MSGISQFEGVMSQSRMTLKVDITVDTKEETTS